jgi:hypothetical protein
VECLFGVFIISPLSFGVNNSFSSFSERSFSGGAGSIVNAWQATAHHNAGFEEDNKD